MQTLTLKPQAQPLYQVVNPQNSHPKLTLRRVLWVKFLRYIDNTKFPTLRKHFLRLCTLLLTCFCVVAPQFALGMLYGALTNYREPLLRLSLIPCSYTVYRFVNWYIKKPKKIGSNEHSFYGVSVDEFATFLIESGGFKFKEVQKRFGFSQDKYSKIGDELEGHEVLVRGENNARVLNKINREQLIQQLRDSYPLVYSKHEKEWVHRRGAFDSWVLNKERDEDKERKRIEKKERKIKRLDKAIQTRSESLFTTRQLEYA